MNRKPWALLLGSALFSHAQAPVPALPVPANLNQLMRGSFYPAANVVFAAQDQNPADIPRAKDPNMATDPLTSVFGKWEAVENGALAITEAANLLTLPGRKCSNGVDVPVNNPDWAKFIQQLRDAGMMAYKAAQAKDQDKMIEVADVMSKACAGCHGKYREKKLADRCK
jgi:hypothetical protein